MLVGHSATGYSTIAQFQHQFADDYRLGLLCFIALRIKTVHWTLFILRSVPFFNLPAVEWEYLLTGLGIVLGLSGARDIGLNKKLKGTQNVDDINNGVE